MENNELNETIFAITIHDLQRNALEKIGRLLTDEEINISKKGLEYGLLTDIDTVYKTIFNEIIYNG